MSVEGRRLQHQGSPFHSADVFPTNPQFCCLSSRAVEGVVGHRTGNLEDELDMFHQKSLGPGSKGHIPRILSSALQSEHILIPWQCLAICKLQGNLRQDNILEKVTYSLNLAVYHLQKCQWERLWNERALTRMESLLQVRRLTRTTENFMTGL